MLGPCWDPGCKEGIMELSGRLDGGIDTYSCDKCGRTSYRNTLTNKVSMSYLAARDSSTSKPTINILTNILTTTIAGSEVEIFFNQIFTPQIRKPRCLRAYNARGSLAAAKLLVIIKKHF